MLYISYHCCADDTQLLFPFNLDDHNNLQDYPMAIKDWMSENFLQLNPDENEVLAIGPESISDKAERCTDPLTANVKQAWKTLGVFSDQHMKFECQIKGLLKSCFFKLRNIGKIKNVLLEKKSRMFLSLLILIIVIVSRPSVSQL